ncbi:MAG: hypothetical protein Q8K60_06085, partial [Parachlamydiaceae bacterium]|nr:hypothetical protein [Parachlamydiaceae bacterium]
SVQKKIAPENSSEVNKDLLASLRFYPYLDEVKKGLELNPTSEKDWINDPANHSSLANQWKVEKENKTLNRQSHEEGVDLTVALQLPVGSWSSLMTFPNGNLTFYRVNEKGESIEDKTIIASQVREIHSKLSDEAQRLLMSQVIEKLKKEGAISLAYLNTPSEEVSESASATILPEN